MWVHFKSKTVRKVSHVDTGKCISKAEHWSFWKDHGNLFRRKKSVIYLQLILISVCSKRKQKVKIFLQNNSLLIKIHALSWKNKQTKKQKPKPNKINKPQNKTKIPMHTPCLSFLSCIFPPFDIWLTISFHFPIHFL